MVMLLLLYHLQIPALQMVSFPAASPLINGISLRGNYNHHIQLWQKTVRATLAELINPPLTTRYSDKTASKQEDGSIEITKIHCTPSVRFQGEQPFNLKCLHQDPTALPQLPTAQREDFRQLGVGLLRRHCQGSHRADENHQGSACLELRWPSLDDAGCVWRIFWLTVKNPLHKIHYVGWKLHGFHEFRQDFLFDIHEVQTAADLSRGFVQDVLPAASTSGWSVGIGSIQTFRPNPGWTPAHSHRHWFPKEKHLASWWFQPVSKILVKMVIFPK